MIYAITTQKGGVGKTTTAAILAQAATARGKKCLTVDFDPQGNLSYCFGVKDAQATSYDLLHGTPADYAIQHTKQGTDVIMASPDLQTETSSAGSAWRLAGALEPIKGMYHYIFIDTPATAGELQYNAMQAADRLIIPLEADAFNLQSLAQTMETADAIRESNPKLKIAGIIFTKTDGRPIFDRQMRELLADNAAGVPFLGTVRKAVAVKEATGLQLSLYEYAPRSNPAIDYMNIFEQLEEQEA